MRRVCALLGLCHKYGEGRVEAVCQSALAFDVINVVRVAGILKWAAQLFAVIGSAAVERVAAAAGVTEQYETSRTGRPRRELTRRGEDRPGAVSSTRHMGMGPGGGGPEHGETADAIDSRDVDWVAIQSGHPLIV